ncbi:MAG: excinuclease ABC subunit UvrA [Firmicutes bacterium]|nr:excinuclease ABC subunit UvrA [Bacillota bacterium]
MSNEIIIKNANENNLRNFSVRIPRDKLVVLTGLSGSGKSSLAFDTIYAEGQRRYVESLSSYARQFLGQMDKPDVEMIEGLSPAISIDQKTTSRNPRSTVGTVTEIHDYLRLMYARIGVPHCPVCGRVISSQSVDQIVDSIMEFPEGTRLVILAPVVRQRKGLHEKVLERIRKDGYTRVRIDGEIVEISAIAADDSAGLVTAGTQDADGNTIKLEKNNKHTIEIVIDRIIIKPGQESRVAEAVELALREGEGLCVAHFKDQAYEEERTFSSKFACPDHGVSIEELEPRMFSFNSPFGACPVCNGLGFTETVDKEKTIDYEGSIRHGAFSKIYSTMEFSSYYRKMSEVMAEDYSARTGYPLEKLLNDRYADLPEDFRSEVEYGTGKRTVKYTYTNSSGKVQTREHPFEGVVSSLERRYRETGSEMMREWMSRYMSVRKCPECQGKRLKPEVLAVTVGGKNLAEFSDFSVRDALDFVNGIELSERDAVIAKQILKEIRARLSFLSNVGLEYLTLSRSAGTLSGGESQRIRLATQIGSGLVGVLYILDEPSIGLHQRDNHKLLATLRNLTELGNTLIVVEHDEETMYAADHIVDIGPGAGIYGGRLVCQGTVEDIKACPESITGQYLSGAKKIEVPAVRRPGNGKTITIKGARANNLKNIDVDIPLGKFVCVTGVSGSGKSSLINEILNKGAARVANRSQEEPGDHDEILGLENIDKVIDIDQSPIGRTPRSNPATYTGMFTRIRDLFAALPEAKMRGFGKGRFSFNVKGGRCEACSGDGIIKIEMHFLPDVYVPCEVCKGRRYNRETLEVKYKGKSIFDVLDMSVSEGLEFFRNQPGIRRHLETLNDVGLGYIKIGQPSTQLSGGEAQRVKLATELSKRDTGNTLYILDEPTTGLHFADVDKLIQVLQRLVDAGNTVVVIEHNLDVIKCADHIIDLGPEGGDKGGTVIASGTPEEVAADRASYTGQYLKGLLCLAETKK